MPAPLVIKEMQIKTTLIFHVISVRMAIIRRINTKDIGKRKIYTLLVEMQISPPIIETSIKVPQNSENTTTI
jgi:hypothetical protein